ncbi:MAG: hypothetical protein KKE82_10335 [Proteobacteria bacterium]|nr:hypothetical protein [Pseudomonadota bacterium]MBU1547155.1 hypothetical protein [Pseudomonadota bacterium]
MKNRSTPYWQGALLVAALFAPSTSAYALGLASPLGWQGNGSKIIGVDLLNPPTYLTVLAQQTSPAVSTSTGASHENGIVRGSAQTRDYAGWGNISASGHDANTGYYRAGGYFKDELYFESKNNPAAIIEFVFNVSAKAKLLADGGRADLSLNWTFYDGSTYTNLSSASLLHITGNAGQSGAFNGPVTMAMNAANSANVLASGAYLPFTFGIWGDVANAEASWENMISLADVLVKDTAGNILSSQDYILRSANGSINFSSFENPPAAVPLPSSLLLFSFASAGIAGLRRRRSAKPLPGFVEAKPLFHPTA